MKLGFIGTGNLAGSILHGVVESGKLQPSEIMIFDLNQEKIMRLETELSVVSATSAKEVVSKCENVVIAVKPKDIAALIESVKAESKENDPLIISTAAGTQTDNIVSLFGYDARVARIMPNLNAAVGESMTAVCTCVFATESDKAFVSDFCSCFGKNVWLEEKYFSAFTAIAGSAPAFAFMFVDALTAAGIKYGLSAEIAQNIASQMMLGSAKLMLESSLDVSRLIRNVCSPAGTTIEGVCSLKETGFENSIIKAVEKTVEKDRLMNTK